MAGAPSKAEVHAMLQAAVGCLETARANGAGMVGTGNALDVLEQSVEGDFAVTGLVAAAQAQRGLLSAPCSGSMARQMLTPIAREYGRLAGSRHWNGQLGPLLADVWQYWNDESDTVETRSFSFATPSANGSNTGDGTLQRLGVDAYNFAIENAHAELKTARCVVDQNNGGRRHEETFRIFGVDAGLDSLDVSGSGASAQLPARHSGTNRRTGSMLANSSFQTYSATATPKFSSWTETSGGSNLTQDTTNYYRAFPGDSAEGAHALKISGNAVISQKISVRSTALVRSTPYYFGIMYNRAVGSGSMTLRIRLGSQTVTVALSAQTGWNELKLPLDTNSWWQNFNEDELDLTIEVESYSSGYVLVDDAIFAPLTPFNGTWWFLRGGATPFQAANGTLELGDEFTMTDTARTAPNSKIQYWWWRAFGSYLPHSDTPTVADP